MGKVLTTLVVSNAAELGRPGGRSQTVNDVLVDTGAMLLSLPARVIRELGLEVVREVEVVTALGLGRTRIFRGVYLEVEGREGTFDCLEVPDDASALLGVIPMEALGLEPDLKNQRLRLLPDSGPDNYLTIL